MNTIELVGICGSLRAASYNRSALRLAAQSLAPDTHMTMLDISGVPLFNSDEFAAGFPPAVAQLREAIRRADGVVIASPEYNFSIPGVLKNVLDYLSRGADQPFAGKPVAMLSASMGMLGGARMQYDLRKSLMFLEPMVLVKPEVLIGLAQTKFSADGTCTDRATIEIIGQQMTAFRDWIVKVQRMAGSAS